MRRLVIVGVFFELALLIVGVTWVAPVVGRESEGGRTIRASATTEATQPSGPVEVTLRDFAIEPGEIVVPAGDGVTFAVANGGATPHTFAVEVNGETFETPTIEPGADVSLDVPALAAGTYRAICTVPGHADLGMVASVVAGDAGSAAAGIAAMSHAAMDHSGLTAEEMAESHRRGVEAFPAETEGQGNQLLEPTIQDGVKVFQLTAEEVRWEVEPGVVKDGMAYNGQVPGPQIRVQQGDRIRLVLHNEMSQPTVLHTHGMTVPNEMDGVPYITQDPVMPGERFVYEFTVRDPAGTYVYHSHFNSTEQVGSGLYGALIVEPKGRVAWDAEYTLFLGDGPLGFTLNGKGFPATQPMTAPLGDNVLIRLANDGSLLHPMHLHGYHFKVVAQDGIDLEQPYSVDTLVVAPGQRFDVLVDAKYPGAWAFHCHILPHVEGPQGMFGMVTALVVE